jgi:hypothetical protein
MIRFAGLVAAALMLAPSISAPPAPEVPPRNPFDPSEIEVGFVMPDVDVELILMADVSGSMTATDLGLQRAGYVAALRSPQVASAVMEGGLGRIALAYAEFAGEVEPVLVVPWAVIGDAAGLADFAARLAAAPDRDPALASGRATQETAVGRGIVFAHGQLRGNGLAAERAVIDVSGDGADRGEASRVTDARDRAVADGITINGLPIRSASTDAKLGEWYRDHVIGGPGAFLVVVDGFGQFGEAVRRKLVLEIAGRPVEPRFAGVRP